MLGAAGVTVVGPAHLQAGEPGQDASSTRGWRGGWIACVADGMGSRHLSGMGARCAVRVAQAVLRSAPGHRGDMRAVATQIYREWLRVVGPARATDAATTLLVAACDARGRVRTWQLGDGLMLARIDGAVRSLTPPRTGFSNETRALGVDKSWAAWSTHEFQMARVGDLVLLMTDGVADDLVPDAVDALPIALFKHLSRRTRRQQRQWMAHELTHWATPGHSDDKSLALIYQKGRVHEQP
jgi:serine/threonine protein phosphatase PrpC